MVNVGINGFGRIGRNVLRAALGRTDFQVVAVNDLTDSRTLAHLLKYDSLAGTFAAEVEAGEGQLKVDGRTIRVFSERDPAAILAQRRGGRGYRSHRLIHRESQSDGAYHPRRRQTRDYFRPGQG